MLELRAVDTPAMSCAQVLVIERLRLGEIDLGGDAGIDLVLHDLQGAAVSRQRLLEGCRRRRRCAASSNL